VNDTGLFWEAKRLAIDYQIKYYALTSEGDDAGDAFRHGVWAIFVAKYGCYRYSTVSEASLVAYEFVDLHECNDYSASSNMDRHNNYVSLKYYGSNAERYRVNWLNYNRHLSKISSIFVSKKTFYA
jgi:hypothetical protein